MAARGLGATKPGAAVRWAGNFGWAGAIIGVAPTVLMDIMPPSTIMVGLGLTIAAGGIFLAIAMQQAARRAPAGQIALTGPRRKCQSGLSLDSQRRGLHPRDA
jgi:hypothetical protein